MTDRTSRSWRDVAVVAMVSMLLASVLMAGFVAAAPSFGDERSRSTIAANSPDQATDGSSTPALQVAAVRSPSTRAFALGHLRTLVAVLTVLGAAAAGLAAGSVARDRFRFVLADGSMLLPHRRGPPALV